MTSLYSPDRFVLMVVEMSLYRFEGLLEALGLALRVEPTHPPRLPGAD
ncbi:hypothetical protein KR51_00006250 [Rubidibacter lacunae KORDI 51-2]|uniref:Uncharacterized protein n=1 Tax=Rubidibacter lacunae KORDI 51-2 TaxID=582515 RepID=U5DSK8_9CHRO|nr:hypothetical protein KR51_00006250 [Rubidibacter lacunae KORDI 51-2]